MGITRVYIKFKGNMSSFLLRCRCLYHSGGSPTDTIIIHRATSPVWLKNLDCIVTAVISLSRNTDPWFSTHSLNVWFNHTGIPEAPTQCSTCTSVALENTAHILIVLLLTNWSWKLSMWYFIICSLYSSAVTTKKHVCDFRQTPPGATLLCLFLKPCFGSLLERLL